MVKGVIIICKDPTSTPALIGAFYAMEKFLEKSKGKNYMKLHLLEKYFLIKLNINICDKWIIKNINW